MCPDRQIISVYADGELPSPWKEKLERHLSNCPSCSERLAFYRRVSGLLHEDAAVLRAGAEAAADRARDRLPRQTPGRSPSLYRPLWRRSVAIPLPAAAAAAVLIIILSLAWVRREAAPGAVEALAGVNLDIQDTVPVSGMEGVLQYLSAGDNTDYVILTLPERNFMSAGEPAIIKAADYSGRNGRQ
jgi:anti-sigma factor RsiW